MFRRTILINKLLIWNRTKIYLLDTSIFVDYPIQTHEEMYIEALSEWIEERQAKQLKVLLYRSRNKSKIIWRVLKIVIKNPKHVITE